MQLVQATCKFPGGQPRTSSSGREYVSALFTTPDGQEHRVYAPPAGVTTEALQALRPGQTVTLALDARGKAHLAVPDQQAPMGFQAAPTAAPPVPMAPVPVAPPVADLEAPELALADVWARAFARLVAQGVPPEVAGPGASTILIQLGRR